MEDNRSRDPRFNFYANPPIEELFTQQGKNPITDWSNLPLDPCTDDDWIDDFLHALDDWRGHNRTDHAA